jgi:prephenate dehydrogenase
MRDEEGKVRATRNAVCRTQNFAARLFLFDHLALGLGEAPAPTSHRWVQAHPTNQTESRSFKVIQGGKKVFEAGSGDLEVGFPWENPRESRLIQVNPGKSKLNVGQPVNWRIFAKSQHIRDKSDLIQVNPTKSDLKTTIDVFVIRPCAYYSGVVRWNKITIVGVGLLGGSLGLALKRHKLAREVAGFVRRKASLKDCESAGAVDYATTDLLAAVSGADLVVLCTPLAQMRQLVQQMLPALKRGAVVTDVGSVKASVVRELEAMLARAGAHFVGSHPMAGAETTGVLAARANLFECAVCVTTPTAKTNKAALRAVENLWKSVGGRLLRLAPESHDKLVSRSSHLPHVVASVLAAVVLDPKQPKQQALLCANGFRDTTRIASGSPEMWRDIVQTNRIEVRKALDSFVRELQRAQVVIRQGNPKAIAKLFETAKTRRDQWRAKCISPSPE